MQKLTPPKNAVIVKISTEARRQLFYKDIVANDGKKISLVTAMEYQEGCAECGLQTVGAAEVVSVGSQVKNMQPGDMVLMDYTVEMNKGTELGLDDPDAKYYTVLAITSYHDHSYYIGGNQNSPTRRAVYKKGEIDHVSPIMAVVRGDEVIANDPYIILNYEKPESGLGLSKGGILVPVIKEPIITRTILSSSDALMFRAGDKLLLAEEDIFERSIDDKVFSIVYTQDVLAKVLEAV